MNESVYDLWKRRNYIARELAADSAMARRNGEIETADELQRRSDNFQAGADALVKDVKSWVLARRQPIAGERPTPAFRGNKGMTLSATEAIPYGSYVDALNGMVEEPSGEYLTPEPLDYHLKRQTEHETAMKVVEGAEKA